MKITGMTKVTRTIAATAALGALTSALTTPANAHGRYIRYSYQGQPALAVTAALVQAGGGPANFSTARALTSMVGAKLVQAEVAKLTKQYGKARVASFLQVGDFAVKDALRIATKAGVKLPQGNLRGKQLASTLVTAGLNREGAFDIEVLLDKAVTHDIHEQVMDNIDRKFGGNADANYHKIANQAFYDLAQALGAKKVKLHRFH